MQRIVAVVVLIGILLLSPIFGFLALISRLGGITEDF